MTPEIQSLRRELFERFAIKTHVSGVIPGPTILHDPIPYSMIDMRMTFTGFCLALDAMAHKHD